jgi:excisionase family DNA binding protein
MNVAVQAASSRSIQIPPQPPALHCMEGTPHGDASAGVPSLPFSEPAMPDPIASALEEVFRKVVREEVRSALAELRTEAPAAPDEDRLLTLEETRDRLRISNTTLWQMRRQGKLQGRSVGRRVLIRESDVNALVNGAP